MGLGTTHCGLDRRAGPRLDLAWLPARGLDGTSIVEFSCVNSAFAMLACALGIQCRREVAPHAMQHWPIAKRISGQNERRAQLSVNAEPEAHRGGADASSLDQTAGRPQVSRI